MGIHLAPKENDIFECQNFNQKDFCQYIENKRKDVNIQGKNQNKAIQKRESLSNRSFLPSLISNDDIYDIKNLR